MSWSISGAKQFEHCQRQWFYKNIAGNARVQKDPYRREMAILSKVKSIDAWRGTIVDRIISNKIVLAIKNKYKLKKDYFVNAAFEEFENQMEFAEYRKYREPGFKFSEDEDFAALFPFEFGEKGEISEVEQARLKDDISNAIGQFLEDNELISRLQQAENLFTQRPLSYRLNKFSVRGTPDLIATFKDEPPHIFDWKVHTFGVNASDKQLVSYAIALNKVIKTKPHKDFPKSLEEYDITQYKLSEYQLLQKEFPKRDYVISDEVLMEVENYISSSILSIYMTCGFKKYEELEAEMFETAYFPENSCPTCPFKEKCKLTTHDIRNSRVSDSESRKVDGQLSLM